MMGDFFTRVKHLALQEIKEGKPHTLVLGDLALISEEIRRLSCQLMCELYVESLKKRKGKK